MCRFQQVLLFFCVFLQYLPLSQFAKNKPLYYRLLLIKIMYILHSSFRCLFNGAVVTNLNFRVSLKIN